MSDSSTGAASSPAVQASASKIPHLRWWICSLLFFITFINYVDRVSLGAMAPLLKAKIGWDDAEFGLINFSFQLSYAVMFVVAGRLLDRYGVRTVLTFGVIVWSLAAMGHALAASALAFAVARFVLGLGEATNFPACIKVVAEWFPQRQRALATGIFNTGTNFGAMLQGVMMYLAITIGWQTTFIAIGSLGFLWLIGWLKFYRSPSEHPRLSSEEAALIRADSGPPVQAIQIPWPCLLRYREAWAFCLGKMLTDPVWWFYLTWLPSYLQRERNVSLSSASGALLVIYLAADAGSIFGGWLSGYFMRRGWPVSRARLTTMLLAAVCLPISAMAIRAENLWTAVALIALATSAHQAWSANMFTIASDTFPARAVASIVGFGGMCGAIGGLFMNVIAGGMLQWLGSFTPLFIFAGIMHPIAWFTIRTLVRGKLDLVDLDKGLRTAHSPVILLIGGVLAAGGVALSLLVINRWDAILAATKNSLAAGLSALGAAVLLGLIGAALVYASRAQKV
jgi:ACS family hexuronate transporter-like MFS transporter